MEDPELDGTPPNGPDLSKIQLPLSWSSTEAVSDVPLVQDPPSGLSRIRGASTAARLGSPSQAPARLSLVRCHCVVLVDDNHHHRRPLLRALRAEGHNVLHAADGPAGELLCQESKLEIDTLIVCADMKRMGGFELARRVRRICPQVRVLLMSRPMGPEEARRACDRGYSVIEEPFTPEQLCHRLRGFLGSPHEDDLTRSRPTAKRARLPARIKPPSPKKPDHLRRIHPPEQTEGRDPIEVRTVTAFEAPPLVVCFWCERLHPGEHPLSVCPACVARYSTLRSLEMSGSYPLSDEAIDEVLTRTSPGNYALGYLNGDTFDVFFVGRSDSDVRQCLHDWVGAPSRYNRYAPAGKAAWASGRQGLMPWGAPAFGRVGIGVNSSYTRFAYSYANSPAAAFHKECRNYDDFGRSGALDNEAHPIRAPESSAD